MDEDQNNQGNSILSRVMQSQQTDVLEHFNALETVNELLKQLSVKESDVLKRRFGLQTGEPETLETIGQSYKVTRERVRQIQRWAVQRLLQGSQTKQLLRSFDTLLQQLLEERGGVMLEDDLLQSLHSHTADTPQLRAATLFLLEYLLPEKFKRVEGDEYKTYWTLSYAQTDLLQQTIAHAEEILGRSGKPLSSDDLLRTLQSTEWWKQHADRLTPTIALAYLSVSRSVERNPFGEYGLRNWGSVVPKRMNDKILLVLRKSGKPMHFQEITQKINEIGFDHRQAYPPTVHNELILNPEYVLIGRGIYALKEWGYKPGVVADVLVALLQEAGRPMSREELVEQVLKQRMVKKNTVHLALTNKHLFQRTADGLYTLADNGKTNTHDDQPRPTDIR